MAEQAMSVDDPSSTPEDQYDLDAVGAKWKDEVERASRYFEKYRTRCAKIEKIYLSQQGEGSSKRKFPMLWANISVLQPACYASVPQPAVDRRFKDTDPVARIASEMIERALTYLMETANIDSLMRQVRDDFLLCARGTAWLRYEADIEPIDMGVEPTESIEAEQAEQQQLPPDEQITDERVCVDYVHWSDFLHSPARRWEDVTWVARRVPMSKEEIKDRFGEDALQSISGQVLGAPKGTTETERAQTEGKTGVWEIWCKTENYTVWIADGSPKALEVSEPPLDLVDFWPCPKPAYDTMSTSSLIPVPDYVYYEGQVEEINTLTNRIAKLTDQLRLKIFYPSGDGSVSPAIEKAMRPENDTVMVPIPEWAAFTDKGGSKAIVTLPIDEVQNVITACIANRKQLIDDVYQITGISDIVRGDTQASETATAQRIKSQWGSIRIRDRQNELARFARDVVRMAGEIVCDLFQPQTLMAMTGVPLMTMQQKQQMQQQAQQAQQMVQRAQAMGQQPPPPPQPQPGFDDMMQQPTIDEVVQLMRDDNVRGFRIDIETDSTIEPDEDAEKKNRMEFAQVIGGFIQQAGPIAQQQPELIPVMGEVMLWVARGFRTGRQLEASLEKAIGQLSQTATAPKPPPQPTPDAQIKLQTTQVKAQAEQSKAQLGVAQAEAEHRQGMEHLRAQGAMDALNHQRDMSKLLMRQPQPQPQGGFMQ